MTFANARRLVALATACCLAILPVIAVAGQPELDLRECERPARFDNLPRSSHPGLLIQARSYPAYSATEWQLRLRHTRDAPDRLFENLASADFNVRFSDGQKVVLHWGRGSRAAGSDFEPKRTVLKPGAAVELESYGGRSSDGVLPYFNLFGGDRGVIVAIGWSGDWHASFSYTTDGVRITAGLRRMRFRLGSGETVRLPSVLVMTYTGTWIDGQNQFRRLMLHHFTPRHYPPMKLMPVAASVHGEFGFHETTESNLVSFCRRIGTLRMGIDTVWLDAGWNKGGFPRGQGNLAADRQRFPNGLSAVGRAAQRSGLQFLAWFEPERVMQGTWMQRHHPDWLLCPSRLPPTLKYMESDGFLLLDLGNPRARQFVVDYLSRHIRECHLSIVRLDFNIYPSFYWKNNAGRDEIGLREVRYVDGLYRMLDELQRRHPQTILDNCASGGRRLDFEMMRRCVALWRSDSCWDDPAYPRNVQAMTYGLSLWLPLHGLGAAATDVTSLRSGMGSCASYAINFGDPKEVDRLRRHLERYLPVRHLFAADFYPLTEWSLDPNQWLAFQFHDPVTNEGLVQAFCRRHSSKETLTLRLKGLAPDRNYTVFQWDQPDAIGTLRGDELVDQGITVRLGRRDAHAIVLQYRLGTPRR